MHIFPEIPCKLFQILIYLQLNPIMISILKSYAQCKGVWKVYGSYKYVKDVLKSPNKQRKPKTETWSNQQQNKPITRKKKPTKKNERKNNALFTDYNDEKKSWGEKHKII